MTLRLHDRDELTARPGNPTAPKSRGMTKSRRQGSGCGIIPRSHVPIPGRDASEDTQCHRRLPRHLIN
ncbi:MAG: hypothetical protein ACE5OZ_11005 [Candidatus Heimdallarchaeota archaeon]